jgi:hypothetical protein
MTRFNAMRHIFIAALIGLFLPLALCAQVITGFTPKYGSPGDPMTINGSGFATLPLYVNYWNGIPLTAATIVADNKILVTAVPAGISTGPIGVSHDGTSWNYSADIFTVISPWAYVERIEPSYGTVGTTVNIHGIHFGTVPVVKFGGVTASSVPNAAGDLITAYVPAGAPSNSVVTVTALGGTSTNATPFIVVGAGPYIAEFSPSAGSDTQPVTLTGLHFTGTTAVRFNGQLTSFTTPTSDKELKVTAPIGVTTGPISVTTPSGSYTNPTPFYGPIRINGFLPSSGPVASQVLISGTNFTGASAVKFGGFSGINSSFVVLNNNQILAAVPTNAPTGILVVATPAGSFPTTTNFVVTPSITGFTPQSGAAGTPVLISGTRLLDNGGNKPTVKFNGTDAVVNNWNPQLVLVIAPASSSGAITLTTADGASTTASPFYYPPRITGFSPNANPPGAVVALTGQSLTNASSVLFNGVPSTNVVVLNNTSLQATVPTGITTGPITVTTPGGTTNSAALYYALPVITAFAPDSGGVGTSVTVFGSSFQGTTSVKFNGTNAAFSNVTGSQLTAVVPAGASTGPITVTAPAGTATSAGMFVIPQSSDLRINTFLNVPNPVAAQGDLTLTIVPSNSGPNTASNVTASVTLAAGVLVKSASTQKGTVNTNGNPVVFTIGSMTTFENPTLTLVVAPQASGSITNTVTLSSSTFDPNSGNNTEVRVTTVLPPPELSIGPIAGNQVRVSWPVSLSNFLLQSTLVLTNNPPWANVPGTPAIEGNERVVTQPSTGAAKYYRLKQ